MQKWTQRILANWIPPLNSCIVTDLDGCAVNSLHRQNTLANGMLDLNKWRENSTPELIAKDSLTLWGERAKQLNNRIDLTFAVCTSRVMQKADFDYLTKNLHIAGNSGLIWSRPNDCTLLDHELKEQLLTGHQSIYGNFELTLALNLGKLFYIDDLQENCQVAENLGLQAIHVVN